MKNKKLLLALLPFLLTACDANELHDINEELITNNESHKNISKSEVQLFLDMNSGSLNKKVHLEENSFQKSNLDFLCANSLTIVSDKERKVLSYNLVHKNDNSCNPLDLVNSDFDLIRNPHIWQIPLNVEAPYYLYNISADSNHVGSVGYILENALRGLRNQGVPPVLAPGTKTEWIETSNFEIYFDNFFHHDRFLTSDLEIMRDRIACLILETYFNSYNTVNSNGILQTIGRIKVRPDATFCGGKAIFTTVSIGYIKYSQDNDEVLF
ncbi:hypothetical protein [Tenacibaculum jejuense]|uniref:Probable lipoprotein n=1 Tax=Tenacibaculum jejuense TaxID=584609 RepID=A0A238UEU1_9FLAO|nr:hypothetical protein [Tenacibaculum jejuense]SNR17723.1 Probable lipoprotein precursor [Tenacibaculum jejuense]